MLKKAFLFICVSASLLSLLICGGCGDGANFISTADKDSLEYAKGFRVFHHTDYTTVEIVNPWDTARLLNRFYLVDRNKKTPEGLSDGIVVRTPVLKAGIYTSVQASIIEQIGMTDHIIGICEPQYLTSPELVSRIKSGKIHDLGASTAPDIEKIIKIGTDALIVSPFENAGYGAAEKTGLPIIEGADYMETHPLARCEWVKFYALFFGKEKFADSLFNATKEAYNKLKDLASQAKKRPSLLPERKYGGVWFMPGGQSYMAVLYGDAGADYFYKDNTESGSFPLQFESVLEKCMDADIWLLKYASEKAMTYQDLKAEYPPYANFKAFKKKNIYTCSTVETPYYDDITLHPDYILKDLVKVFHPELLPDYELRYFSKMAE